LEGTVGRTDFAGGSEDMIIESVKRLAKIEKNYTLLCGHGEPSTLDREKLENPYFVKYA
jgi:glyoxylase-like metal-dependent hydrolase (beta-lactamase superfamily II)